MDQTVTQPMEADTIQADISGAISGQVIVGKYNVQIGSVHGGVVNINLPDQRPRLRARPSPVYLLPRRFAGLLDRVAEVEAAARALPAAQPVEIHAPNGTGKSSLLRILARHSLATAFPDGVIYLSALHQTSADLLQSIFDALFEYDALYKPSEGEIRHALQEKRALILLDDVDLSREEIEGLLDAAPECAFLLATPDRKLWREGVSLALPGLPPHEARLLLERELGRTLSEEETAAAAELFAALSGNPLGIIQAAALVREQGYSVKNLAGHRRMARLDRKIAAFSLGLLSEPERKVTAAIAALNGAPLNAKHLPALIGISQVDPLLDRLQKRGLIQQNEAGFTMAGSFASFVQESWDLTKWRERLLGYFRDWAAGSIQDPLTIVEDADAILRLIEWANQLGRSKGALELVKIVEGALALGLRWGAWGLALQAGFEAAQAARDRSAKAWALHQLGTRALGLGERAAAQKSLKQALRLRERLGDRDGAAVTRHNLDLLIGPPGGDNGEPPSKPSSNPSGAFYNVAIKMLATLVVSGAILSSVLVVRGFNDWEPPAVPSRTPTVLASPIPQHEEIIPNTGEGLTPAPSPSPTAPADELTATDAPTVTEMPPSTVTQCSPRQEWPVYYIRPGDTLGSIALATGSSVQELGAANCLPDTRIYSGQPLFVPRLPVYQLTDTPTPSPTATATDTLTPTTPAPQLPDLVVSLQLGPVEWADSGGEVTYFITSLTLNVTNQGSAEAGPFAVVVYFQDGEPVYGLPVFEIVEPLGPGASHGISDDLLFTAPIGSQAVEAWAVVDDCNVQELPAPCAVLESDEGDNQSAVQSVPLPGNEPPFVTIANPDVEESFFYADFDYKMDIWFVDLDLEGYAEDPEDGPLDGGRMVWTTDQTALQDGNLGTGAGIQARLYSDSCAGTTHTVTLTATDSQGASNSLSRWITVAAENCNPTLTVEIPIMDIYPPTEFEEDQGRYVLILPVQAWSSDVIGQPIGGDQIEWTTDQTGIQAAILGYGEALELWLYLPDHPEQCDEVTHTVLVTVTDYEGNQASESYPIHISDCVQIIG